MIGYKLHDCVFLSCLKVLLLSHVLLVIEKLRKASTLQIKNLAYKFMLS